jgi:GT2 family glycosyltransferase
MLSPTNVFWQCGGFDLNLFLYSEEYDVAMRLKRLGKVCVVDPTHRFTHLQGKSTGKARGIIRRESYISGIYCYQKYHSNWLFPIYKLVILLRLIPRVHDWHVIPAIICGNSLSRSMRHRL